VLTVPIRDVITATPRARIVHLDLEGRRLDYAAGQAVIIGSHGQTSRRPYSLASAPADARRDGMLELLIGVDDIGAAGLHLDLRSGSLVDVDGPLGRFTFPDRPSESRFLFIAGGTGIAPLRAMLHQALTVPHEHIGLLYSARTPDEFAFQDELRTLARDGKIELRQTITRDSEAAWEGGRGRIGRAELQPLVHDAETLCFVCGPASLVHDTRGLLEELGVTRERVRVEEW